MYRQKALSALAALTLLAAAHGTAQADADTIPAIYNLNEVEVTATRARQDVAASAPSFAISQEKMKAMGVTDIADALHRMPGLNVRDYGGAGGMKTVSVRGFGATHTGVIYDGVVLSDCQSGKIDLSRYSLDNVGSLSMVVGDNSDIFIPAKAAASAATISITSLAVPDFADSAWHMKAQLKGGSFGMVSPFLHVGKAFSRRFSFSVLADYTYADNNYPFTLRNGDLVTKERRSNSRMNSGHGELNWAWQTLPGRTLTGKAYYYDNSRQLPGAVVLYNPVCHEHLRDRNFFGQLAYKDLHSDKLAWTVLAKFNWDASLYHDEDGKYPGGVYDEDYWQREVYASGSLLFTPHKIWAFDYSADYAFNNLSSNQPNEPKPYRHTLLQSATARMRTSRVLATARLLYSVYNNEVHHGESARDANKLSPSLSLSWQPLGSQLLYIRASYKNIFRMPTFNDSYFFHMGSVSLKPETTDQFNVGITYQAPSSARLPLAVITVDGYINHVKDKIVAIPQNMFIWTMANLDKVRAFGVDVTADVSVGLAKGHAINLTGNYSFQRVQPRTHPDNPDYNKQVAYTPKHSGTIALGYENPWANVSFHATGASERYGTNSNLPVSRVDGYVDCGLTAWRVFPLKGHSIEVRGDLTNIFNKQYYVVARYPMPGRAWRLTLSFTL